MKVIGLTGNIGCGKTTVSNLLKKYPNVVIFDCDKIAKDILKNGNLIIEINYILETNVFWEEGPDLRAIAQIIFNNEDKKILLEKLIHPLMWGKIDAEISKQADDVICIVESALLFEKGSESRFSNIIVTTCPKTEQVRRLKESRFMSEEDINARIKNQITQEEKVSKAQFVIDTHCTFEELENRVDVLYKQIQK